MRHLRPALHVFAVLLVCLPILAARPSAAEPSMSGLALPASLTSGEQRAALRLDSTTHPLVRVAYGELSAGRPHAALVALSTALPALPPASPAARLALLLSLIAEVEVGERAAALEHAQALLALDDGLARIGRVIICADDIASGQPELWLAHDGPIVDGLLGDLHALNAAVALAQLGRGDEASDQLRMVSEDSPLRQVTVQLEAVMAERSSTAESEQRWPWRRTFVDSLRAAQTALDAGALDRARAAFYGVQDGATMIAARLDPGTRARRLDALAAPQLLQALNGRFDRGVIAPPLIIDRSALRRAALAALAPPSASAPLRLIAAAPAETPAELAEAALDAEEAATLDEALARLDLALGTVFRLERAHTLAARRRLAQHAFQEALAEHRREGALALDRARTALERATAEADTIERDLERQIGAAVLASERHLDRALDEVARLRDATRGLDVLFPEGREAEPEFLAIHRQTVARDRQTLDELDAALEAARAALPRVVRARIEGDLWPAAQDALARVDQLLAHADLVAGVLSPASAPGALAAQLAEAQATAEQSLASERRHTLSVTARVDSTAHARAVTRLDDMAEAAGFGHAESLLRIARRAQRDMMAGGDSLAAESAVRVAATAYEDFLASGPHGPGQPAALLRVMELRRELAGIDFRHAMARYLDELDRGTPGPPPIADIAGPAQAAEQFLALFPTHPQADRALYNLAVLAREGGEFAASTRHFTALRERYPQSALAVEASLRIGDNYFEAQDFAGAEEAYARVVDAGGPLSRAALYKMGWTRLNRGRAGAAALAFARLLGDQGLLDPTIQDEARSTLARCLADQGTARDATAFVATHAIDGDSLLWQRLAEEYTSRADYDQAIVIASEAAQRFTGHDVMRSFIAMQVELLDQLGERRRAAETRMRLARDTGPGSAWFADFGADSLATASQTLLLAGATQLSILAREDGAVSRDALLEAARSGYAEFRMRYPEAKEADRAGLLLAETELALDRPRAAAGAYTMVAETAHDAQRAHEARYGALVAWQRERGAASPDTTALGDELRAIDAYLAHHAQSDEAVPVYSRRGAITFAAGRHDDAAASYTGLLRDHPSHPEMLTALRSLADAELKGGHPEPAARHYVQVLALAAQQGAVELVAESEPLLAVARFRIGETRSAAGEHLAAAEAYRNVALLHPDFPQADLALLRAAEAFGVADRGREAENALAELIATHPESPNVPVARLRLAALLADGERHAEASRAYLEFARQHADHDDAATALLEGVALARRSQSPELVIEAASQFLDGRHTARDAESLVVRTELVQALFDAGREADGEAELERLLVSGNDVADADPSLAHAALMRAERRLPSFTAIALVPPITEAVSRRRDTLAPILADLGRALEHGAVDDRAAAANLLAECLFDFALALEESEIPADLEGADLITYSQAVAGEADGLYARAESSWRQAITEAAGTTPDWLATARGRLFERYDRRYAELATTYLPSAGERGTEEVSYGLAD